jgi:hypothetical protein
MFDERSIANRKLLSQQFYASFRQFQDISYGYESKTLLSSRPYYAPMSVKFYEIDESMKDYCNL